MSASEGRRSQSLSAALEAAELEEILPQLVACAERRLRRLGLREGRAHRPSAAEVMELVNESILRCLDGRRTWDDANPPDLVPFLCGVIKSVAWEYRKDAARYRELDDDALAAGTASAAGTDDEVKDPRATLLEELIKDDAEIEELYLAIAVEGLTKRDDIAHCLGWHPDKVSVVRKRIQRRIEQRTKGKT